MASWNQHMKMVTEQEGISHHSRCYTTGWKREVLIICDLQRPGASNDLQKMSQMFAENGFVRYVESRPTKERFNAALHKFWKSLTCDGNVDGFVLVIMAHGSLGRISLPVYKEDYKDHNDYRRALREKPVELEEVFQMFDNRRCPVMRGKPKLFIVQSCREEKNSGHSNPQYFDSIRCEPCLPQRLTSMSDYMIVYSTHPGKGAYRLPWRGCPLFSELKEVVDDCGLYTDIQKIFVKVGNRLKQRQQRDRNELGINTDEENSLHVVDELSRLWYLFNPHLPHIMP